MEQVEKDNITKIAIDDFALLKRKKYGTVIIDQETGQYVQFIESRKKEDVKETLKEYKNLKLVTRDRATAYGNAISEVNPDVIQIADFFHFLANLTDKAITHIRTKIYGEVYFDKNFQITKSKPNSEYVLKRNKIETFIYNGNEEHLNKIEKKLLRIILKNNKDIEIITKAIKKMKNIVKNKDIKAFKKLIQKWEKGDISILRTYTKGIYDDFEAVCNAVKYDYTNGIAEGKINKIKTIKRQCYGRSSFELLTARLFLHDYFLAFE